MASRGRLTLEKRLKRTYRAHKITKLQKGDIETLLVDGKEIDLAWKPYSDSISDKGAFETLVADCKKSIKRLLVS
jgi:hypothetical protein